MRSRTASWLKTSPGKDLKMGEKTWKVQRYKKRNGSSYRSYHQIASNGNEWNSTESEEKTQSKIMRSKSTIAKGSLAGPQGSIFQADSIPKMHTKRIHYNLTVSK